MSICYCKTVVHGESRWAAVSVVRILQNEKYKGDLLMQKYYIRDFLTKELEKNDGKLTQYYVENDHEAIIERHSWYPREKIFCQVGRKILPREMPWSAYAQHR